MTFLNKIILSTIAAVPILLAIASNPGGAVAAGYSLENVGGINLNYYCKKTYGSAFKAKLFKQTEPLLLITIALRHYYDSNLTNCSS